MTSKPMTDSKPSSVGSKMLNVLVAPAEVFDEVLAAPYQTANWRLPTLLVSLAAIVLVIAIGQPAAEANASVMADRNSYLGAWPLLTGLIVGGIAFGGTFWTAASLWLISRWFLRVRLPYLKTVEVVGLSGTILLLGTVVTGLLIGVTGDIHCRPSPGLLFKQVGPGKGFQLLETFNFFELWSATVLAIGLSRLSAVSFKEAAFWVYGFWVAVRMGLILLA